MEKREDTLREALGNNDLEIQRWESYVRENETAIDNLNMFSKKLTVDVMVPMGRKAYIPGRLIHTNEVLVAHFQDYYSKCSAHTAMELCKRRIENGMQHLEELKTEQELFQNKLEKPHLDGVLPNLEQREIIEEYDEEKEKLWRAKHREHMKDAKLKEKQQREEQLNEEKAHDELIEALEEEEMLEELEMDPTNATEDILKQIMSGDIDLPPSKKRVAHASIAQQDDSSQIKPTETQTKVQTTESIGDQIVKPSISTLNLQNSSECFSDGNDSDISVASDTPEEVRHLEKQAYFLPEGDRLGFFKYQLQIIDQKIALQTFTNSEELERRMELFRIRDHLDELIEIHEECASSEPDSQAPADVDKDAEVEKMSGNPPKRRISFALSDQTLEFSKNETVAQMLPVRSPVEEKPQRDIIQLDEPILTAETSANDSNKPVVDRRKTIQEKVEENLKNQCLEDADLVNKIIGYSVNPVQTLHIQFKHSMQLGASSDNVKAEIPTSPSDLYRMICTDEHVATLEDANKSCHTKEADREKAFLDVRSEFLSPLSSEQSTSSETQSRSILKNKSAVERETHIKEERPKAPQKKVDTPKEEEEFFSAYNKVMSDVVENPASSPDALPEGKFVDMHTPKKRISRFKQMRNENK